jgi:hypothetical protein
MGYSITWTETEAKDSAFPSTYVKSRTVDDANQAVQDRLDEVYAARVGQCVAVAMGAMLWDRDQRSAIPQFVPPMPYARLPNGQVLTLGPNGEVYRDGIRLGKAAAQLIVQVGSSVLLLGKTDPKWWQWTGSAWSGPLLEVDLTLLTPPVSELPA